MFSNRVLFSKKEIYFVRNAHIRQILQDTRNSYFNNAPSEYRRNHVFDRERKEKDKVK